MPTIYVKGSCFETPLHDRLPGNKRVSDKDMVWIGEELNGGGGGVGEGRGDGLRE
jgi:hypothetical protein